MGCFGVQHDRKPKHAQASSFCYPESFFTDPTRQANCYYPSPARSCGAGRPAAFQSEALPSRSSLLRHSCSFNLTHSRPPFASSPLTKPPNSHSVSDCLSDIGAVRRFSSYGYGDESSAVSCSSTPASLFTSENEQTGAEPRLFPLPLPPSTSLSSSTSSLNCICHDDVSSGSGSSVCAASPRGTLARSVNSKSFSNNSLGLASSTDADQSVQSLHPSPLPLPPPPQGSTVNLREFSHEELAGACLNFAQEFFLRDGGVGPVFRTVIKNHETCSVEAAVTRLTHVGSHNNFKKWRLEVSSLARLSHPHLCKVAGFSGEDCLGLPGKLPIRERERLLVFEHPLNGSLDGWLYCRQGKAPIDWATRLKIAMGAAQGLAYLHTRRPRQLIYKSFKSINIQLDENFDAKLSDYGFVRNGGEQVTSNLAAAPMWDTYNAPETCTSGELSAQSNVWSFGIVLLELLTGRQTMDDFFPTEEKDLLQWCRPYLLDTKRLYLIMDPELKGRYPTRTAKLVANLALQCLAKDPMDRPSMHDVAKSLCALVETSNVCNKKTNHVPTTVHHAKVVKPFNTPSGDRLTSTPRANQVSRFKMASSHNLVSVLASPARVFLRSDDANHSGDFLWGWGQRARFGLLPGEKNKRVSDMHRVGNSNHHALSRNLEFLSGEIGLQGKRISGDSKSISSFSPDFPSPPPLGRTISAASRLNFISG